MGTYVNPNSRGFEISRNTKPYIDKSLIIDVLNSVIDTEKRFVCVSRPRRFGKTMATNMLSAYYGRTIEASKLFEGLKIKNSKSFIKYANKFDVIKINMQDFISRTHSMLEMTELLGQRIVQELMMQYNDVDIINNVNLPEVMENISNATGNTFVVIIDEWDSIFREYPRNSTDQKLYLDFLRDFLKDKTYISLVYMTGILPIKKYGTQSALNMFTEYSMEDPDCLAEYVGFTEEEVKNLCDEYGMDFEECRAWYDGYRFAKCRSIYNPNSIVRAMMSGKYSDYWNQTETYEALKIYIDMNFDGLKDSIIKMVAGDSQRIDTGRFQNDMTTFQNADDVMTLLIHLGYLGYDSDTKEVFIPNREIMQEFVLATTDASGWTEVIDSVKESDELLQNTWNMDSESVAKAIETAHFETSHLQYNDENALSYTISLAYYSARQYYQIKRELPAGKGFADMVFIPKRNALDKPAIVVELKWDKSAETAISQIREKKYPEGLENFSREILLVGVSYDKKTKKHFCKIEKLEETDEK